MTPVGHMVNPSALLSLRQKKLCRTLAKCVLNKLLLSPSAAEMVSKCLVVLREQVEYSCEQRWVPKLKFTSSDVMYPGASWLTNLALLE